MSAYLRSNFPGILTETLFEDHISYDGKNKMVNIESLSTEKRQLFKNAEAHSLPRMEPTKPKPLQANNLVVASKANEIKRQFNIIFERIEPIQPIKNIAKNDSDSNALKSNIVSSLVGVVVGLLVNKFVVRESSHPVRKLLGTLLIVGVTHVVTKHTDSIRNMGMNAVNKLQGKKNYSVDGDTRIEKR